MIYGKRVHHPVQVTQLLFHWQSSKPLGRRIRGHGDVGRDRNRDREQAGYDDGGGSAYHLGPPHFWAQLIPRVILSGSPSTKRTLRSEVVSRNCLRTSMSSCSDKSALTCNSLRVMVAFVPRALMWVHNASKIL